MKPRLEKSELRCLKLVTSVKKKAKQIKNPLVLRETTYIFFLIKLVEIKCLHTLLCSGTQCEKSTLSKGR